MLEQTYRIFFQSAPGATLVYDFWAEFFDGVIKLKNLPQNFDFLAQNIYARTFSDQKNDFAIFFKHEGSGDSRSQNDAVPKATKFVLQLLFSLTENLRTFSPNRLVGVPTICLNNW